MNFMHNSGEPPTELLTCAKALLLDPPLTHLYPHLIITKFMFPAELFATYGIVKYRLDTVNSKC